MFKRKKVPVAQPESPKYLLLTGVDTDKLLEGYEHNLCTAEARREAIVNEIQRLQVELHKTDVAISAMGQAIGVLKTDAEQYADAFDKLEGAIQQILDNTTTESDA